MGKSMWLLFLAAAPMLVETGSVMAADAAPSHCGADEKTYFSCSTGKKLISICGSNNLSAKSGYLQYRYGVSGKPELVLPAKKEHPAKYFTYQEDLMGPTFDASLSVKSGNFNYIVSQHVDRNTGKRFGGVEVTRDGRMVTEVNCKSLSTSELDSLESLGLPEDTGE